MQAPHRPISPTPSPGIVPFSPDSKVETMSIWGAATKPKGTRDRGSSLRAQARRDADGRGVWLQLADMWEMVQQLEGGAAVEEQDGSEARSKGEAGGKIVQLPRAVHQALAERLTAAHLEIAHELATIRRSSRRWAPIFLLVGILGLLLYGWHSGYDLRPRAPEKNGSVPSQGSMREGAQTHGDSRSGSDIGPTPRLDSGNSASGSAAPTNALAEFRTQRDNAESASQAPKDTSGQPAGPPSGPGGPASRVDQATATVPPEPSPAAPRPEAPPQVASNDFLQRATGTWWPGTSCPARERRSALTPMLLNAQSARAGKTSCRFTNEPVQNGSVWTVAALCSNAGERWRASIRLAFVGNRLTWASERGTQTYTRCP
jgi:hypothetical protein